MAMRGSTVRGTPIHHIGNTAHEGVKPGVPKGYESEDGGARTTHEQYRSDKRGYQRAPNDGTPYHSEAGNGPEFRREVVRSTNAESSDHGNQNDPRSNGPTVLLDTHGPMEGFMPRESGGVMDSPVPAHAARFDAGTMHEEDEAHLGSGLEHLAGAKVNNDLRRLDGVMSRGLDSTSHPGEDEFELTRDDTLKGPEAGSARDVQGSSGVKRIRE